MVGLSTPISCFQILTRPSALRMRPHALCQRSGPEQRSPPGVPSMRMRTQNIRPDAVGLAELRMLPCESVNTGCIGSSTDALAGPAATGRRGRRCRAGTPPWTPIKHWHMCNLTIYKGFPSYRDIPAHRHDAREAPHLGRQVRPTTNAKAELSSRSIARQHLLSSVSVRHGCAVMMPIIILAACSPGGCSFSPCTAA